jgi:hypothetical protein
MATQRRFLSLVSSLVLGALPLGARALAAATSADDPTSAAAADETAAQYRAQAEQYKAMGGTGYKTGLVQRAEADAAKYQAQADAMRSPEPAPPLSPAAQQDADLVAQYKGMGASGYKTGLVQRAQAEERAQIEKDQLAPAQPPAELPCDVSKPAVDVGTKCTGPE